METPRWRSRAARAVFVFVAGLLTATGSTAGAGALEQATGVAMLPAPQATGARIEATPLLQDNEGWPRVVAALEGAWEGSGTLFGNPASFIMSWETTLGQRFLRLTFTNALVADGVTTPVLSAEAYYRPGEPGELNGYWFDTRGEIVTLRAIAGDDRIVTDWQSSSESGRTTYRLVDTDTVEVIDEVQGPDGRREFGRATYTRQLTPEGSLAEASAPRRFRTGRR